MPSSRTPKVEVIANSADNALHEAAARLENRAKHDIVRPLSIEIEEVCPMLAVIRAISRTGAADFSSGKTIESSTEYVTRILVRSAPSAQASTESTSDFSSGKTHETVTEFVPRVTVQFAQSGLGSTESSKVPESIVGTVEFATDTPKDPEERPKLVTAAIKAIIEIIRPTNQCASFQAIVKLAVAAGVPHYSYDVSV